LNALKIKLQAWRQDIGADIPTDLNSEYDPVFNDNLIAEHLLFKDGFERDRRHGQ